ncbi:MAG TPA: MFS transporter [Polyangia bacterium]|nr:MFS transporter [Polyangia bacterium]
MSRVPTPRAALALLTSVNLLNYLDRFIPAAILPTILAEYHISLAKGGILQTLFIFTMAFASPIAGSLGDRHPRFRVAALGVLVWSVATFASGLAPTFILLGLARAVIGFGEASYTVVTPSLLSDFYPGNRRGRALAIFYAAIPVGSAMGYVVGAQVAAHLGWRWSFFVAGVPGIVLALILATRNDPKRGAQDEGAGDPDDSGGKIAHKHDGSVSSVVVIANAVRELFARPSFVYNTIAQTIYTFGIGGLAVWMPTYFVRERGLSEASAGTIFGGLLLVAGFAGTLLGGTLGDRLAVRRADGHFIVSGVALLASLPFTLAAILSPTPAIFWPSMFVTLTLLFLNAGPLSAAMANVLPAGLRSRGFAANTFAIHVLGDAISPPLIGLGADHMGLRIPVVATGIIIALASLVLFAGRGALARDLKAAA